MRLLGSLDFWPVFEDGLCRVMAGCPRDSSARVSSRTAEVQVFYRCPVPRPTEERPEGQHLVQGLVQMSYVTFRQTEHVFQVQRSEGFHV